jgi:pimeloyl-ACP methyl ester carboxylesterase
MSKSKETTSLHDQLDDIQVPVRLLVGGVPHPSGVKQDERDMLAARIPDFELDSVPGSGQYVHEEQPEAVLRALGDLDQAAD